MKKQIKNNKFLIFGNGQIGNFYKDYFTSLGSRVTLAKVDITKKTAVERIIKKENPDIVINAAAKTNLEWIEKNKLEAVNVNVLGADIIASECEKENVFLVHLSSGCIFESIHKKDAKKESDIPEPAAFYSWTKVWAENMVLSHKNLQVLILRPRQPVSSKVSEKNMLVKMLTFTKFVGGDGAWNSGTVLEDMMEITKMLIEKKATGIYHVANEGYTTPYKIGLLLKKHINPSMKIEKIKHSELDKITPVKRVATILDVSKLNSIGIKPDNYEKRLEEIIIDLGKNLKNKKSQSILENTEKTSRERTKTSKSWKKLF